jgi:hypothetical protein
VATTARQFAGQLLSLVGASAGGVLGYYTFGWIYHYGFYGMMVPGALLGLGCGLLAPAPSQLRGAVCAAAAVALGLFTEWRFFPFVDDPSLGYFLGKVASLTPVTLGMIAGGAFFAYWFGKDAGFRLLPGRSRGPSPQA